MALTIKLSFTPFCTNYANSGQLANRNRGEESKHLLKHKLRGQLTRVNRIRAHPLTVDFQFISMKEYPVHNYGLIAQYIIETIYSMGLLQDTNPDIIAEIKIRTKLTRDMTKQGCIVTFDRYTKPQPSTIFN